MDAANLPLTFTIARSLSTYSRPPISTTCALPANSHARFYSTGISDLSRRQRSWFSTGIGADVPPTRLTMRSSSSRNTIETSSARAGSSRLNYWTGQIRNVATMRVAKMESALMSQGLAGIRRSFCNSRERLMSSSQSAAGFNNSEFVRLCYIVTCSDSRIRPVGISGPIIE